MIKNLLKQVYFRISPKYLHIKKDICLPMAWHGSSYGGFFVNESSLNSESIIYSVGIGKDISFDESIMDSFNCKIFGFDPTPESIQWFRQQNVSKMFIFSEYGISSKSGIVKFHLPKNKNHVSGSILNSSFVSEDRYVDVQMKTLLDAMNEHRHSYIDLLKMDIEGAEYEVVSQILEAGVPIKQILVEIHDRFFYNGHIKSKKMFDQLRNSGFKLFGISKTYEEISFINPSLK
ncbi:FkbM family methyltransferase [Algoriphagus formosus]|uniref:FkbM family methyltransferase n=1 Tax=Algoriphagus formosus TaxID=2007308 RepID=A0A4R5USF2_9BACT|nr:FkbM family methyltransferase [Algoriphagus aquimaris]TDK42044.1 FkbM family methyltransferase [Algoriphagus aquimaris]